jgi:hypothetical protein
MHRIRLIILLAGFLTLLGGCPQVGNIRVIDDSPADLENLIAEHEYVRARQLTGKYPPLDSMELQARLKRLEHDYEQSVRTEAGILEADGKLHEAVQILSDALQRIPHSNRLRELRNSIEQDRVHQLRVNEREKLLARGRYLAGELQLYDESIKLEPTDKTRQHEHERNQAEAIKLAGQLRTHARLALEHDDIAATRSCLEMSGKLQDSPEAVTLLSELQVIEQSLQQTTQQKASVKQARHKRKQNQQHKVKTGILLEEIRHALEANQLNVARQTFMKIPASTSTDSEVLAVQARLDSAISARIEQLVSSGDALYRAEKINPALKSWNEALSLSPDNPEIRERTERANKVLARLEELKRQQR